jgi:hypothetical protein
MVKFPFSNTRKEKKRTKEAGAAFNRNTRNMNII